MSPKTHTAVRLSSPVLAELDRRGPRSTIADRDLDRYYMLLDRALRRVSLTVEEACLIADAMNGTIHDARTASHFWAGIEDAISFEKLDAKWGVDAQKLLGRLATLDPLSCMAIVDAAERFWFGEKYRDMDVREAVAEVFGLKA